MLVFLVIRFSLGKILQDHNPYHDEANDSYDRHEHSSATSKCQSIDLDKWLRGIESEKGVEVWSAEKEENGCREAKYASCDCATQDSLCRDDAGSSKNIRKGSTRK